MLGKRTKEYRTNPCRIWTGGWQNTGQEDSRIMDWRTADMRMADIGEEVGRIFGRWQKIGQEEGQQNTGQLTTG